MPAALVSHDRQRRLRKPQSAKHVGVELIARLLRRDFLNETELAVSGVVHQDV
jgi:hypothetical protein